MADNVERNLSKIGANTKQMKGVPLDRFNGRPAKDEMNV